MSNAPHLVGGGQLTPQYFTHEEIAIGLYLNTERNKLVPQPGSYSLKSDYGNRVFQLLNPIALPGQNYGRLSGHNSGIHSSGLVGRTLERGSGAGSSDVLYGSLLRGHRQQAANAQYQ